MRYLGLYLIVKNEENVLERCINSFSGIYDELIIVDTGSTDSTKEIAKKYTDNVYDFKWIDNFAAARNFAYSKVKSKWAMWCDADDVCIHSGKEDIVSFLTVCEKDKINVVNMVYKTCIDETTGDIIETVVRERIHCKKYKHEWKGVVHETVATEDNNDILYTGAFLEHHPDPDREYGLGYSKILESAVKNEKDYLRYLIQLGTEYLILENYDEAKETFLRAYNENKDICERSWAAYEIAKIHHRNKEYASSIEWAFKCIHIDPHFKYMYIVLAEVALEQEDYEMAINWAQVAINISPSSSIVINNVAYDTYYPWELISMAYFNMWKFVESKIALIQYLVNGGNIDYFKWRLSEIDQYI